MTTRTRTSSRKRRPRAAGGVRISEVGGRGRNGGPRLRSDADQQRRLEDDCERLGLELAWTFEELDTSGRLPLSKRPKLLAAVEAVERGEIQAIIFPFRDRQDRSISTKDELVDRVEAKGGQVWAGGQIVSNRTTDAWAKSTLESFANELPSRYAKEKVRDAHVAAIGEGIPPYAAVPGYRKAASGRFEVDGELAEVAVEAFGMRDRGCSINAIRRYLLEHGVRRSYAGVEGMLRSRTYLGEVVFGELAYRGDGVDADDQAVDPVEAHPAIVDRAVWQRVQDRRATRGRQAKSDRLLARCGVLRCGTCGSRMTATNNRGYAFYRCQHNASPDCSARATISAERVEQLVVETLQAERELARLEGSASLDLGEQLRQAARDAKSALDAAVIAFDGLDGVESATRRIAELKRAWQAAELDAADQDRTEQARAAFRRLDDWDRLTLEGRRAIVRAVVDRVVVAPVGGLGLSRSKWDDGRVDVQLVSER